MAATDIFVHIKGVDKISGMLKRVQGKVGGLGRAMGKAVKTGAVMGGVAIAGLGVASLKMAADFETSMAEVRTLLPDISEKGFGALQKQVIALSEEMGVATDQMVPALYQAISAGVPPENVIEFLRTGSKAAIGGCTDLETAIDGLTTITNAWGMESDKASEVADVMFTGVKLGKTTMAELSASMFQAAPLAAALGISVQEVVGATATLTKSGVPTAQAMTQMRQAMVGMSKPTKEMSELLAITGYETGEALIEAEGFTGAINTLTVAADNDKEVMAKAFGSVEALGFVLGVSGDNAEGAAADFAAVTDSVGASDKAFETMEKTAGRKLAKAMNTLKIMLMKVGLKALPIVVKALDAIMVAFRGFTAGFKEADVTSKGLFGTFERIGKGVREFIAGVRPIFEALWESFKSGLTVVYPLIKEFVKFIFSNKPLLVAAIIAIGAAIVLAFGPYAIAIAAIVGLIALIGLLKDNWEGIAEVFTDVIDDIISAVEDIPVIGEIFKGAMKNIKIVVTTTFKLIKNRIETTIKVIRAIIKIVTALIRGDWSAAWQGVKDLVGAIWGGIKTEIEIVLGAIKALIWNQLQTIAGIFTDIFGGIARKVVGIVVGLKNRITGAFWAVINWVRRRWPLLLAILAGPFGLAVYAIIRNKNAIVGVINGLVNWIVGRFNGLINFFRGLPRTFSRMGTGMGRALAYAVKGGLNALITFFERGLNRIITVWNRLEFKVPKVKLGPLGSIGGGTIGVPDIPYVRIPRLQEGALNIADDMLAKLHKGEMVIPRAFADALRTQLTMARSPVVAAATGAGGGALNFYGDIILGGKATKEDARELVDMVETEWRARRRRGR